MKIDIAWDESRTAFDADGSFRDIYVLETTRDDWTRALAYLRTAHAEITLDDKPWQARSISKQGGDIA